MDKKFLNLEDSKISFQFMDSKQFQELKESFGPRVYVDGLMVDREVRYYMIRASLPHSPDVMLASLYNFDDRLITALKIAPGIIEQFPYSQIVSIPGRSIREAFAESLNQFKLIDVEEMLALIKCYDSVTLISYFQMQAMMIIKNKLLTNITDLVLIPKDSYIADLKIPSYISKQPDSVRYNNFGQKVKSISDKISVILKEFPEFKFDEVMKIINKNVSKD